MEKGRSLVVQVRLELSRTPVMNIDTTAENRPAYDQN